MIKFSFSTLGCPNLSWEEALSVAKDLGYDGIELRSVGHEHFVPAAKAFSGENMEATTHKIAALGLEIPCVSSSCYLFDMENREDQIKNAKDYITLASKLGVGLVRVLADARPEITVAINEEAVVASLKELLAFAAEKGVSLLIETNGHYADSRKVVGLFDALGNPENLKVLWDVHHTWRYFGESFEETFGRLEDKIAFIHVKDSVLENGKIHYKLLGKGELPVETLIPMLNAKGYDGYVSLEWVKEYNMELEDPGIVFAHFIQFVKR